VNDVRLIFLPALSMATGTSSLSPGRLQWLGSLHFLVNLHEYASPDMIATETQIQSRPQLLLTSSGAWWKEASIWQVYHGPFENSNDDGVGDISRITSKLG
jgi:hypothetical protein